MPDKKGGITEDGAVLITKYENRRLYDRARAQYITYQDVIEIVRSGKKVKVVEKKTGKDLTALTLLACITVMQEEAPVFEVDDLHGVVREASRPKAKAA